MSDERDLLNQLLGQAQMADAFAKFSKTVFISKLAYVKENKLYQALSGKKGEDGLHFRGAWDEFCGLLGWTPQHANEASATHADWTVRRWALRIPLPLNIEPKSAEFGRLVRRTQCDAQGNFIFDRVADGDWFVETKVTWVVAGVQQGGAIMRRVSVAGGAVSVIVAP